MIEYIKILAKAVFSLIELFTAKFRFLQSKMIEAYYKFKLMLIDDLAKYQNENLTFSILVIDLYPSHASELNKLKNLHPSGQLKKIDSLWQAYKDVYDIKSSFGVFSPIVAELPHPDFGQDLSIIKDLERKRRLAVTKVLQDTIKML